MKRYYIMSLLFAAVAFGSCGNDNDSVFPDSPENPESPESPDTPEVKDTLSIDARPTDWAVDSTKRDPSYSMTFIMDIDTTGVGNYPEWKVCDDDLVGAFMNGTCRCAKTPVIQYGKTLFLVNVIGFTTDDVTKDRAITFKYYSAALKHIFTAKETVSFKNNDTRGTLNEPFKPLWIK